MERGEKLIRLSNNFEFERIHVYPDFAAALEDECPINVPGILEWRM